MNPVRRRLAALVAMLFASCLSHAASLDGEEGEDPENPQWTELSVALPAFPEDKNLLEFDVGPTNRNHFFIDPTTLAVGNDGVVRFTLVVKTPGGARNVSFEGMRCETREARIIATGRADGSWHLLPRPVWKPIENHLINQYQAVLSRQYFCPLGIIGSAAEGVKLLKQGGYVQ